MAREITREEAIEKAKQWVKSTYGPQTGLQVMDCRKGPVHWIVELEGGLPIKWRFTVPVHRKTGEIGRRAKRERL
jgi:hypothetical protein